MFLMRIGSGAKKFMTGRYAITLKSLECVFIRHYVKNELLQMRQALCLVPFACHKHDNQHEPAPLGSSA